MADERHEVWFESSARLGASADLALAATLVPAMTSASELTVAGELDPRLREHLADIQGIVGSWRNDWDFPRGRPETVPVRARAAAGPPIPPPRGCPLAPRRLSSAAGSTRSTSSSPTPSVTHLVFVSGFDFAYDDPHEAGFLRYAAETAAELGRELIVVRTNLREFSDRFAPWISYYGSAMVAAGMALSPSVERLRIASSVTYAYPAPGGSNPLLDHHWTTGAVEFVHCRCHQRRSEKVGAIANDPVAQRRLRVCWERAGAGLNCGRCEKCLRTQVALAGYGVVGEFETLPGSVDLNAVAGAEMTGIEAAWGWYELLRLHRKRDPDSDLVAAIEAALERAVAGRAAASAEPFTPALWRALTEVGDTRRATDAELERLGGRVEELEAELGAREGELAAIRGSRSWRYAGPLRSLGTRARPLLKAVRRRSADADG